jgi:hypothetical protein
MFPDPTVCNIIPGNAAMLWSSEAYASISFASVILLLTLWRRSKQKSKTNRILGDYWFNNSQQTVRSAQTNTKEEVWREFDPKALTSSDVSYFHGIKLPPIFENTEGIAGVHDLWIPEGSKLLLDVGSGKSNAVKAWLEHKYPELTVYLVDPYQRSYEHNISVLHQVERSGGVDIATSISILNVIDNEVSRIYHISLLHHVLKPGGIAYFKVWAGRWPDRGTGRSFHDTARNSFQANRWASSFLQEVEEVFGLGNVLADNYRNILIAKKC